MTENESAPSAVVSRTPRARTAYAWAKRWYNVLLFVVGFLFDVATLNRIDSWLDLAFQLGYLAGLTFLILGQHRAASGAWIPRGLVERVWKWNVEVLHFFYGGLLSNYVVFYAKSATGSRPLVFFVLLVALLFFNEMPAIRRIGHRLRLGLYAFCVASFMIYFVPVLIGKMGDWVFAISISSAVVVVWGVASWLAHGGAPEAHRRSRWTLVWPAMAVLGGLSFLYAFRLVPPVPLSVKFQGVYHDVVKTEGGYLLRTEETPFWAFWRKDSRPFHWRPDDNVFYFVRVFAPSRFHHRIAFRWEEADPKTGRYFTRARTPMAIAGGRDQGFRAFCSFSALSPGDWRASVETEDGRAVGRLRFRVVPDRQGVRHRWIESKR